MPTLTIPVHELHDRIGELPDVDDLYLIDNRDSAGNGPSDPEDEDGLYPVPWQARKMDVVESARNWARNQKDDWGYEHWGWDGTPEHAHFRMGCNSPTLSHPVLLTFQWGEGHPKTEGVEMLVHEPARWAHDYCAWCHMQFVKPADCPERRLRAMYQDRHDEERSNQHAKAVELWHSQDPRADD